jgi:hypothetical protein
MSSHLQQECSLCWPFFSVQLLFLLMMITVIDGCCLLPFFVFAIKLAAFTSATGPG